MADRPREVLRFEHADMRDDVVIIAAYDDLGIGPAVLFDGGGFMDPGRLRAYASDLLKAADWLAEQKGAVSVPVLAGDRVLEILDEIQPPPDEGDRLTVGAIQWVRDLLAARLGLPTRWGFPAEGGRSDGTYRMDAQNG